jgi:hypothetical protein
MDIRWKIALGWTTFQLVSSGCHRAEIDLSDIIPETGDAGSREIVLGAGGAGDPGGAAGDSAETAGNGMGGELVDTSPPRVLSITPSDGQRGVRSDSKIVIRFSQPMNRTQTELAVQLEADAFFAWNAPGTELSITPARALEYGRGADPLFVEAVPHSVRIHRSATDAAGNAFEEEHASTFYTSRELSTSLHGVDALIGYAIESSNPRDSSVFVDPWVGDSSDDREQGFITADLSALPPKIQAVTSATLTVSQYEIVGDPYQMGSMTVEHVSFSALQYVLTAPTQTSLGVLFTGAEPKTASLDVTSALRTALAQRENGENQVQFRFRFERAANSNGVSDEVRLRPLKINVSYLVP